MSDIPRTKIWRLKVQSFVGLLAWAQHYFATLQPPDLRENPEIWGGEYGWPPNPVEVEAILSEENAVRLSTEDYTYKPGLPCERFFSREEVTAAAIEQFLKLAEPGDILVTEHEWMTGRRTPLATKETADATQ